MKSRIVFAFAFYVGLALGHRVQFEQRALDLTELDHSGEGWAPSGFVEVDAVQSASLGSSHYVPQAPPQLSPATFLKLHELGVTAAQVSRLQELGVLQDAPEGEVRDLPEATPTNTIDEDVDDLDEPIDPAELALAERNLQQCARSNIRRMIRIATSVPVFIIASEVVLTFGTSAVPFQSFVSGVYESTAVPMENIILRPFENAIGTVSRSIWALPLVFSTVALEIAWGLSSAVFLLGASVISIAPTAAAFLVPLVQAMAGAVRVTNAGVDIVSNALVGHGNEYPRCCCPSALLGSGESACALVSMDGGQCPEEWIHQPSLCAVPEAVMFNDEQTVHGCGCMNYTDCARNSLHRGHAWCEVSGPERCGTRYSTSPLRRWDYCRIDGRPLDYATGRSRSTEDALATFIPNTFSGGMAEQVSSAFGVGTWVDGNRGLCTAKSSALASRECFVGIPMETLGGCAKACLEDGAPNARFTLDNLGNSSRNFAARGCVAFAYHRQMHTCVRLPAIARHAEFAPHLSETGGDGWQNFVSKYIGGDRSRSCSADILDEIIQAGYTRVRDMNDGRIEVRCANVARVQKVSCIASECRGRSNWCFVRNGCGGIGRRCRRLSDLEHLQCSGERGAIVPSSDPEGGSEYWNAINTLSRCEIASSVRRTKIIVGAPLLFLIGDAAFYVHLNGGGFLGAAVSRVIETVSVPIAESVLTVGAAIFEPAFNLRTVSYLLNAAWYTVMASFAAIFYVSGFTIAIAPAAATFLVPVVSGISGVTAVVSVTTDMVTNLMGYGANYPKCCCAPGQDEEAEPACALVTSNTDSVCPTHWTHDPSQCNVPEAIRFSVEQTPMGCQCSNYTDCTTNPPYRGHAWCEVEGDCGMRHTFRRSDRWDYCRIAGQPLNFATGSSTSANDALATFIPNEYESWPTFLGPENAFRLGTWTNADRGLATASNTGAIRQCFAGIPAETVSACAHMCLDEGAPSARAMSGFDTSASYTCVAFAFNRAQGICVRLPAFAADAKFTPSLSSWDGPGWQNFVSRNYGDDACSVTALLAIERRGFSVSTSSNDGHLQLQCANGAPQTQKASCKASECAGETWCFVENDCGGFGNGCIRMRNPDPLGCLAEASD